MEERRKGTYISIRKGEYLEFIISQLTDMI